MYKVIKVAYQSYMDFKPNYQYVFMIEEDCKLWCNQMSNGAWSGQQWIDKVLDKNEALDTIKYFKDEESMRKKIEDSYSNKQRGFYLIKVYPASEIYPDEILDEMDLFVARSICYKSNGDALNSGTEAAGAWCRVLELTELEHKEYMELLNTMIRSTKNSNIKKEVFVEYLETLFF